MQRLLLQGLLHGCLPVGPRFFPGKRSGFFLIVSTAAEL
jgi:hypothetical protein